MSDATSIRTKRLRTVAFAKIDDRDTGPVALFHVFSRDLDADGKQPVAAVQEVPLADIHPSLLPTFACREIASLWAARAREATSPSEALTAFEPLYTAISDGTWSPGRVFDERE